MNELAAEILTAMIERYGVGLARDPVRCEGLLRDSCRCNREIFVLIHAIRQKVPADLLEPRHALPQALLRGFLAKRLQDELAFSDEAARWAVATWASALGIDRTDASANTIDSRQSTLAGTAPAGPEPERVSDPVQRERWADVLENGTVAARLEAINGLAHSPDTECTRILIGALDNSSHEVRVAAYDTLGSRGAGIVSLLIEALGDTSDGIIWRTALLLGGLGAKNAAGPLTGLLERQGRVQACAIWALGEIRSKDAITPLMKLVNSSNPVVRDEAVHALKKIGGE